MAARTGLRKVSGGKAAGLAFWEEAGVPSTVVADDNGSSAELDDLDTMGVTRLSGAMVVVPTMDRVDRAGRYPVIGLLLHRLEHRAHLSAVGYVHPWNA